MLSSLMLSWLLQRFVEPECDSGAVAVAGEVAFSCRNVPIPFFFLLLLLLLLLLLSFFFFFFFGLTKVPNGTCTEGNPVAVAPPLPVLFRCRWAKRDGCCLDGNVVDRSNEPLLVLERGRLSRSTTFPTIGDRRDIACELLVGLDDDDDAGGGGGADGGDGSDGDTPVEFSSKRTLEGWIRLPVLVFLPTRTTFAAGVSPSGISIRCWSRRRRRSSAVVLDVVVDRPPPGRAALADAVATDSTNSSGIPSVLAMVVVLLLLLQERVGSECGAPIWMVENNELGGV